MFPHLEKFGTFIVPITTTNAIFIYLNKKKLKSIQNYIKRKNDSVFQEKAYY